MNIDKIKGFLERIKVRTFATKTALQYILFVFISFVFWLFVSLNDNVQYDVEIPIKIGGVPDSSTIISDIPKQVNVSVTGKGLSLLKFVVGESPELNLKFKDYISTDGSFYVSNAELRRYIRGLFESNTNIQNLSLEDIDLKYTNLPGKKVPIILDADVQPNIQYTIYGENKLDYDSAMVYSDINTLNAISSVRTSHLENRDLRDSLFTTVDILPIEGAKIEPNQVRLMVPVEPLISKKMDIPVVVKNMPSDLNVITFPSKAMVSFLVPISLYHKNVSFEAVVDYKEIERAKSNKVSLDLDNTPSTYMNISLEQDSVEFVIERY